MLLKNDSVAVISSNDIMPTNADGTMKFRQNSDLFYLTGILQEETILLLYPGSKVESGREVLFVRDHNPDLEVWEGKKLSLHEAGNISGINAVFELSKFEEMFHDIICKVDNIYLNLNEHDRASNIVENREMRFIKNIREKYPLHIYCRLGHLIYGLRVIKSPVETDFIKKACELSDAGFRRIMKFLKPGVYEYEIEAELAHEFIKSGSSFADYEPIIASGENSCYLHYIKNDMVCNSGDVLLIDAAAGYANYNSDMTRTLPVNGKFSQRQKQIYNAVLRALRGTISEMKPGRSVKELQYITRELIGKELVDLGLLKANDIKDLKTKSPIFKKYYPHDVSHFLGLAVHDVGMFDDPMQPGMVLTCEPGIYILEEKLGVRIENNILITENGNIDFMADTPVEPDEIEDIMNSR
jgi:Xaa-Pro aminopeptidase